MDDKEFIKLFPSLEGEGLCDYPDIDDKVKDGYGKTEKDVICYLKPDILKHCLDKKKVKEDIERIISGYVNKGASCTGGMKLMEKIFKELGLE